MSLRLSIARRPQFVDPLVIGWRLGLGPLLGRPLCLVTASPDGDHLERAVLPYVFSAGDVYVPAIGDPRWAQAASQRRQVTVQAHPGPLATRARRTTPEEAEALEARLLNEANDLAALPDTTWWVLQPTGDPGPPPALADLNWVWGALAFAVLSVRRLRRRR